MEINNLPIKKEIDEIINSGAKPVHAFWSCIIETPEKTIEPIKLFSLDIVRNYDENFSDLIIADMMLPAGVYEYEIWPYRNELTILIKKHPINETNDKESNDENVIARRYRAIPTKQSSETIKGSNAVVGNKEELDISNLVRVEFQLMDIALEQIRLYEVGGIYKNEIPGSVAKHVLTKVSTSVNLPVEDRIHGVSMVSPDNKKINKHVVLPHGIKPMDVPTYIQDNWGGIYSTGIGCYLQNGFWYIWPEFNTRRFETSEDTLTIFNLPPNLYNGIERTYRVTDRQTVIIATGDVAHEDNTLKNQLNRGSGTRFVFGDKLFNGFGTTQNNKHTLNRASNTAEFFGIARNNNTYIPVSPERITNNIFAQTSRLAKSKGSIITLVWEYTDSDIIYPGMPVKFVYVKNNEVVEMYGVVYRVHHFIHTNQEGLKPGRYLTNSAITIFVE